MTQLKEVKIKKRDFDKFKNLTPSLYKKTLKLSKKLKGKKVLHINSTANGGGVAELLQSLIPYQKSLEINAHWFYIKAPKKFYEITKKIHNLLQGEKGLLTNSEKKYYLKQNQALALSLKKIISQKKPDIIIIHDPQPLAVINYIQENIPILFRLHIDLSRPNKSALQFLKKFIEKYDSVILTHASYRPAWLSHSQVAVIKPSIDPFRYKNKKILLDRAEKVLKRYHIDIKRPIVTQISRFDQWKDPLGVIEAYRLAKKEIPGLQLILVGFFEAKDDPEGEKIYRKAKEKSKGDKNIFLFADIKKLKEAYDNLLINALYTASTVVLQKSLKEGFGLTVTEAMWKEKAVIGGKTIGIKSQITHNKNGFIVSSPKEAAKYIVKLIKNPKLRKIMGKKAHQSVKDKFLMSQLVLDHLNLYLKYLKK